MRITLVEDNLDLASGIAYRLRDAGHAVDHLDDGLAAEAFLKGEPTELIILDVNLPGQSGLQLLHALRGRGDATPVLLLTARDKIEDRVQGLDAGADDYLVKPFEMEELEARLRALARRRPELEDRETRLGSLLYDQQARMLREAVNGEDITPPRKELSVLECLLRHRGTIVSKTQLLDYTYGVGTDAGEKVIEVHVSRLRKRLSPYGVDVRVARGLGYMLVDDSK